MSAMRDMAGQRLLVTGGASGIGLAVAQLAVARGATVAVLDVNPQALAHARQTLGVHALECDVADAAAVREAVAHAADALAGMDTVVNNAGIDLDCPLDAMRDADWQRVIAVNLTGAMLVSRAALPFLKQAVTQSGHASIVNVASAAGLVPLTHRAAYCASKAGMIMFGKALAVELAVDGIRVNAVCPGAVDTPLFVGSYAHAQDPQAALQAVRSRYALRRTAQPQEIAEAVLYLGSRAASYITGAALAVDGGRSYH